MRKELHVCIYDDAAASTPHFSSLSLSGPASPSTESTAPHCDASCQSEAGSTVLPYIARNGDIAGENLPPVPAIYESPVSVNITHSSQSDIMNSSHTLCLRLFSIRTAQRSVTNIHTSISCSLYL